MNYSFYTRGDVLWVRINLGVRNQKIERSSGISIKGLNFNKSNNRVTGRGHDALRKNREIADFESKLIDAIEKGDVEKALTSPQSSKRKAKTDYKLSCTPLGALQDYCSDIERGIVKRRESTVCGIRSVIRSYADFVSDFGDINLLESDIGAYSDRQERAVARGKFIDHINEYVRYLADEDKSAGTIQTYTAFLFGAINVMGKKMSLILPTRSDISLPSDNLEVNALTPEQAKLILLQPEMYKELQQLGLRASLRAAHIILLTALRISDVRQLDETNLREGEDGFFIRTFNQKTGALTTAPITTDVANMIKDKSLPMSIGLMQPQKDMRKVMVKFPELHQESTRMRYMNDGTVIKDTRPLYDFITPHMLRRTAITTMLIGGVPEHHVRELSGHKHGSPAFARYVAYSGDYMRNAVRGYQTQLLGTS